MKKARIVVCCSLLAGLLLIAGCWDSREVENLAIMTLIAWDRVTVDGMDLCQVSTRIVNPSGKPTDSEALNTSAEEILIKGTGITVQDAFNEMTRRLPAKAFWEQDVAIILGERAAQEELPALMASTLRFPHARLRVDMFVCEGEAAKILESNPELSSTLSKEISKIAEKTAEQTGVSKKVTLLGLSKMLLRTDRDTIIPKILIFPKQKGEKPVESSVKIEGFGVIRENKLVGWLNEKEALGYLLGVGNPKEPEIPIAVTKDDIVFSYYLTSTKGRVSSKFEDGKPKFTIRISTGGIVHEAKVAKLKSELQPTLEKATEERIIEIVLATISKAKEYNADIFGLFEQVHRYHPRDWQKIEPNWREYFQDAEIEVEVDAKIRSFGTSNEGFNF